jgi:toxin CcdB
MTGFQLYQSSSIINKNYSYLLDVQSPLLEDLKTRLVIPLIKKSDQTLAIKILNPIIVINKIEYIVLTQQMAAVPNNYLGNHMKEIEIDRTEILSAIDFLITGF